MLGRKTNSLVFPRLKHIKEVKFSRGSKKSHLYELDWYNLDKLNPKLRSLPEKYDKMIRGMRFALSDNYLKGIQHFSKLALQERNRSWGYDTCIRENCLKVSQSSVETAMMLLADCAFDEEMDYWYPYEKGKLFLKPLMIYKFWAFQTGRGIVRSKSGVDNLIDRSLSRKPSHIFEVALAKDIKQSLDILEEEWEQACSPLAEECGEAIGPAVVPPDKHELLNSEIKRVKDSYKWLVDFFGEDHPEVLSLKNKYAFL